MGPRARALRPAPLARPSFGSARGVADAPHGTLGMPARALRGFSAQHGGRKSMGAGHGSPRTRPCMLDARDPCMQVRRYNESLPRPDVGGCLERHGCGTVWAICHGLQLVKRRVRRSRGCFRRFVQACGQVYRHGLHRGVQACHSGENDGMAACVGRYP